MCRTWMQTVHVFGGTYSSCQYVSKDLWPLFHAQFKVLMYQANANKKFIVTRFRYKVTVILV